MHLPRSAKVMLGLLTALPALYVILFSALIVRLVVWRAGGDPRADTMPVPIADLMWMHLAVMLLIVGLETFYLLYLFKTGRVPPDQRARWAGEVGDDDDPALVSLVINVGAMPLFFALHVWPERARP